MEEERESQESDGPPARPHIPILRRFFITAYERKGGKEKKEKGGGGREENGFFYAAKAGDLDDLHGLLAELSARAALSVLYQKGGGRRGGERRRRREQKRTAKCFLAARALLPTTIFAVPCDEKERRKRGGRRGVGEWNGVRPLTSLRLLPDSRCWLPSQSITHPNFQKKKEEGKGKKREDREKKKEGFFSAASRASFRASKLIINGFLLALK